MLVRRAAVALVALSLFAFACARSAAAAPVTVFTTDFETGLPSQFTAQGAAIEGVQGYAGLGPVGRQFGGQFLRYSSVPLFPTTLTVRNLPPHNRLSVKFLLAVIDSWDGAELMQISVDGVRKFNHWFEIAVGDTTDYTPAPPGAILSMSHNLGFNGGGYFFRDRAYDLGVEPAFLDIPHTADSVTVVWEIGAVSGPAANQWQGGFDESWAIDAVRVEVEQSNVAVEPGAGAGAASALALAPPLPNPARAGALRLRFTLPSDAPATIALFNVAGRRVVARDVGAFGAGEHEVSLNAVGLAPGVYVARLTQGAWASVRRVVLLP